VSMPTATSISGARPQVQGAHPFLKIGPIARLLFIIFFLVFGVFRHGVPLVLGQEQEWGLVLLVVLRIANEYLVLAPILHAFPNVGYLHPLVYPFLFSTFRSVVENPLGLFMQLGGHIVPLENSPALGPTHPELLQLNIQDEYYQACWMLAIFAGYFLFRRLPVVRFRPLPETNRPLKFILLGAAILAVAIAFFQTQGGVVNWIVSWGLLGGRREAMEGLGPILKLFLSGFFVPLAWYLTRGKRVLSHPVWYVYLLAFAFLCFAAVGSRSSVFLVFIAFFMAWMLKNKSIPYLAIGGATIVVLFLFGLLGQIRSASTYSGGDLRVEDIDVSVGNNLDYAEKEGAMWAGLGTNIAIYGKVTEEVGFLYGRTYVAALTFFVPRFIWPSKPHGAGYYTGKEIFKQTAGVPPGPVAEAYWNFGWPGILGIGLLNGLLISWVVNLHLANYQHPGWQVLFIIIITTSVSLSTLGMTNLLQKLFWVVPGLKFLRLL